MASDNLFLDINKINRNAGYPVSYDEDKMALVFLTDKNVQYKVAFIREQNIFDNEILAYHFALATSNTPKEKDDRIKNTVIAIIEEFFYINSRVILYICDAKDAKEAFRHRLFQIWFESSSFKDKYIRESIEYDFGNDNVVYSAAIYLKSNPYSDSISAVISSEMEK